MPPFTLYLGFIVYSEFILFGYALLDSAMNHDGITIRLIQTTDSTFTDVRGYYEFRSLQPDTYTVVATYDGYEPSFSITNYTGSEDYRVSDLQLNSLPCTPRDSFPNGYPIGVHFCTDISFWYITDHSFISDSLFIGAWEYSLSPFRKIKEYSRVDTYDIMLISSLGDKEVKHVDIYLGSIPEIWNFGYIIDTVASERPLLYNGVIEIESTGGWVIAMYQSYWFKKYICKSLEMRPKSQ